MRARVVDDDLLVHPRVRAVAVILPEILDSQGPSFLPWRVGVRAGPRACASMGGQDGPGCRAGGGAGGLRDLGGGCGADTRGPDRGSAGISLSLSLSSV